MMILCLLLRLHVKCIYYLKYDFQAQLLLPERVSRVSCLHIEKMNNQYVFVVLLFGLSVSSSLHGKKQHMAFKGAASSLVGTSKAQFICPGAPWDWSHFGLFFQSTRIWSERRGSFDYLTLKISVETMGWILIYRWCME